ncbi:MAG: GAF domain-containing protein [Oculatellaceae cyanobacterium Prado106]|jgi:hypothetical protein|nr:GAF domain-containing protein [Oculatellaceae cyanobacterium Prado106]
MPSSAMSRIFYQIAKSLGFDEVEMLQQQMASDRQILEQTRQQQATLSKVIDSIRASLSLPELFASTTEETCRLLNIERVTIYQFNGDWSGQFVSDFGFVLPDWSHIAPLGEKMKWADTHLQETQGGRYRNNATFAVEDIYTVGHSRCHLDLLEQYQVRAYAIAPIFNGTKLWGLLAAYQHSAPHVWEKSDVEFLAQIAAQFGVALKSAELLAATQAYASEMQKAAEQRSLLLDLVTQVRETLDIDTIFSATSTGLRRALNCDRVGIYEFDSESKYNDGTFIAEDSAPDVPSALQIRVTDHCFGENYAERYSKGRMHAIDDLNHAEIQDCHRDILEQFKIQAQIIAPIRRNGKLWGLLCAHQCTAPRHWNEMEKQFLRQVTDQLGIALQQADLLAQTQQQATQLATTLEELQRTQLQIVQTEKMAGLGQLVAGVAHEINNPINFIHGNLAHVEEYTADLFKLINLYQQQFSEQSATPVDVAAIASIDLKFLAIDYPKVIQSMKVGTNRIREIVLSLRNFSRLDEAEYKSVDIHEGIDSTLLILAHRFKASPIHAGIQVERDYGQLPLVECYPGQLNQVFMNLLSNAIDALEEWDVQRSPTKLDDTPSTIRIWTEQIGTDAIAIHFTDNGSGIPEAVQNRLFDPFFTTKAVGKGTGLGLSISYQIITERHCGKLVCYSSPGAGAEFVIEIPIYQSQKAEK